MFIVRYFTWPQNRDRPIKELPDITMASIKAFLRRFSMIQFMFGSGMD